MQETNINNLNELAKIMFKHNSEVSNYLEIVKRSLEQQKEKNSLISNEELFGRKITQKEIKDNEKLKELLEKYEKELTNRYENVERMRIDANQQIIKEFTNNEDINHDNKIEDSIDFGFLDENNSNELNNELNINNVSNLTNNMESTLSQSSKFEKDIDNKTSSSPTEREITDHLAEIMGKNYMRNNENNIELENDNSYNLKR